MAKAEKAEKKAPKEKKEKAPKEKKEKKEKGSRPPSAYNTFMKEELPKIKAANPNVDHKEAFKLAAANWKNSPSNPNNKK
ncbi:hypothetical protein DFJ74DRAFT_697851 [Hyaloraphidium curvatum]|nr:hypothetical protein DFJ74DRAFT_697851 [Hyaloraphidium curvatum]